MMTRTSAFSPLATICFITMFPVVAAANVADMVHGDPAPSPYVHSVQLAGDTPLQTLRLKGVAGRPIPLKIDVPQGIGENIRFVMVRGLPDKVTLSSGFRVKQSWLVAINEVNGVQLVSPEDYKGDFTLEFFFVKDGQERPASSAMRVQIAPPGASEQATVEEPLPTQPVSPQSSGGPAVLPPAQEADMLQKGQDYLGRGDVASARMLFEELSAHGSAKGALAMARSYDPNALKEIWIVGTLQPDAEKAKLWYQRASDLGDSDAQGYMKQLESN
jgi:hypothetical protein